MENILEPLKIFISYSHKDKKMKEKLISHMSALVRQKYVMLWYDNMILPGKELDENVMEALRTSQIVLLLLSADYLASDYCYDIEMKEALMFREQKKMEVIPILLREVDLKGTPVERLLFLPEDRKAVSSFQDEDGAYKNIVDGIRRVAESWYRKKIPDLDADTVHHASVNFEKDAMENSGNHGFEFHGNHIQGGNFVVNNYEGTTAWTKRG